MPGPGGENGSAEAQKADLSNRFMIGKTLFLSSAVIILQIIGSVKKTEYRREHMNQDMIVIIDMGSTENSALAG